MSLINRYILCLVVFLFGIILFVQAGNEVVEYRTSIKIIKDKKLVEKSFLIQVNDKESDWISDVEIRFKKDEKLEILEASIIDSRGVVVRKLKKKDIITRSDLGRDGFYDDNWIKEFKLKWNNYPYQIKYRYQKTYNKFLFVAYWRPFYYSEVPTRRSILQVDLPRGYSAKYNCSKGLNCQVDSLEERIVSTWEINDLKSSDRELFAPPYEEIVPQVKIIPNKFDYAGEGSFKSWASMGEWVTSINKGLDKLTPAEKLVVDKLLSGVTDQKEKVKILYHYLQDNTRYINVSLDVGGLKPHPASYVCVNKYGDCKALTIYMKALLNYAGIESFYTLINAGSNAERVNRDFPGQQFNHVILTVPVDNDTLWLENTATFLPFNYLGTFTQSRFALRVNGADSKLVKTPSLELDDVMQKNTYIFKLYDNGSGNAHVIKDLKGRGFEGYKYDQVQLTEKDQKREIEKYLPLNNYEELNWNYSQTHRDDPRIIINLDAKVKNQFRKLGGMIVLKPVHFKKYNIEKPGVRKNSVRIIYPVNRKDSVIYNLSFMDQYQAKLPANKTIESKYGRFVAKYLKVNKQLTVIRELQIYKGEYSLEEYNPFYQFIESMNRHEKESNIILNPNTNEKN